MLHEERPREIEGERETDREESPPIRSSDTYIIDIYVTWIARGPREHKSPVFCTRATGDRARCEDEGDSASQEGIWIDPGDLSDARMGLEFLIRVRVIKFVWDDESVGGLDGVWLRPHCQTFIRNCRTKSLLGY